MYAVIQTGGKQYRVQPGDTLTIERIPGSEGDSIEFDQVLMFSTEEAVAVGRPLVEGARVNAKIVEHGRGEKLTVYKFKRRKDYRRRNGHRQELTKIEIGEIVTGG